MKIFDALLEEIEASQTHSKEHIHSLESFIKSISKQLLDENFNPSIGLKNLLDKYLRRAKYPMEVAIVGQFSSGKSTFLNAILSKDVLPTGITPVTSKVNFLNYADEYKFKITFKSGATEYHNIEHLAKFTDQRESIDDVKYLSLYAPVEMLKEISFVDTPGLNSQSSFDTQTTNTILRDVDGIIWLGLIDAVAKKSELDVLEKFLPNYANKSICLLNQKDRISPEQVDLALEYARSNYKNFFSKTVAISAKQALDSRINQKANLLLAEKKRLIDELKNHILLSDNLDACSYFATQIDTHKARMNEISSRDYSHHLNDLEASNILEVLEFIENVIRPKAKESKVFAIKKDLSSLCDILIDEYQNVQNAYTDLKDILDTHSNNSKIQTQTLQENSSKDIQRVKIQLDDAINSYTHQIYAQIKPISNYILKEKKSLLGSKFVKESYQSYTLDSKSIKDLNVRVLSDAIEQIVQNSTKEIQNNYKNLESSAILWQLKTAKLTKKREVASDIEYTKVQQFSASLYEHTLNNFALHVKQFECEAEKKLHRLSLKYRFALALEKTVLHIVDEINTMQNSYEKDPLNSVINSIDESEITLIFKEYLDFNFLKRELDKTNSFMHNLLNSYAHNKGIISHDTSLHVSEKIKNISLKITAIEVIKSDLSSTVL